MAGQFIHGPSETDELFCMVQKTREQAVIQMSMGTVGMCHMIGPARSHMHFNTFDCLQYQNAQPSVEDIQIGYRTEGCAVFEDLAARVAVFGRFFEGEPVGAQPIVSNCLKPLLCSVMVADIHATLDEEL